MISRGARRGPLDALLIGDVDPPTMTPDAWSALDRLGREGGLGAVAGEAISRDDLALLNRVLEVLRDPRVVPAGSPTGVYKAPPRVFQRAVRLGRREMVKVLAAWGADLDATDAEGRTPADPAERGG